MDIEWGILYVIGIIGLYILKQTDIISNKKLL